MNKKNNTTDSRKFLRLKTTTIFITLVVLFLASVPIALALETGLDYGTYTGLGTQDIRVSIMKVVRVLLGLVGIVALIIVLYGGYIWMTSGGNSEKIDKAKKILVNAAIGLVIIFSAFAIVSFIISALEGSFGFGGPPRGQPPGGGCVNCHHLGSGIIEYVYPVPFQRDVARNTKIVVKFKVAMNPDTIFNDTDGTMEDSITIFDGDNFIDGDDVQVATSDNRTFVFSPDDYLGDGDNNVWYTVDLTNDIKKDNGDDAFLGGLNDHFSWRFEIGIFLDLDPVEMENVFPQPDNSGDNYSLTPAAQAFGSITVTGPPKVATPSEITSVNNGVGDPPITISGSYNCLQNALVCVRTSDGNAFSINPKDPSGDCSDPQNIPAGFINNASLIAGSVNISCGLELTFASDPGPGDYWDFKTVPAINPDTLKIRSGNNNHTFTFGGDIVVGATNAVTAENIRTVVDSEVFGLIVTGGSNVVTLTASTAGTRGNLNTIEATGSWANENFVSFSGGSNAEFTPSTVGAPDKPRNAVITIDFNEPIDPTQVNNSTIIIEYDTGAWTAVDGTYLVSSDLMSVDFISNVGCVDASGDPITNACGERIFCLPVIDPDPYEATHYRVRINAGLFEDCSSNSDCNDNNFGFCDQTPGGFGNACRAGEDTDPFYPEARDTPNGIVELANNSFNGNDNTYNLNGVYGQADGPQSQSGQPNYNLNGKNICSNSFEECPAGVNPGDSCNGGDGICFATSNQGDDMIWYFYINKNMDLSPPNILEIGPNYGGTNVSVSLPIEATFDELLMASTIKPGTNYKDGFCACNTSADCVGSPTGTTCDTDRNKCVSTGNQNFCHLDKECSLECVNKKYLTLIDFSQTSPVGWWVSKLSLDTGPPPLPLDGWADQTMTLIQHTKFIEQTNYGEEIGSGIKDVYQNCYLPGQGPKDAVCSLSLGACSNSLECTSDPSDVCVSICDPAVDGDCCLTVSGIANGDVYCCNGTALNQGGWENSACYSGY